MKVRPAKRFGPVATKSKPVSVGADNPTRLLNRKAVKDCALAFAQKNRAGKFTRVSRSFLERININTRNYVEAEVQRHPSVGKTLQ